MSRAVVEPVALATRAEWLAERRLGIGASEVPAVLGISPFMTPLQLFGLKVGVLEPPEETDLMRLGRRLEPVVAGLYEEETARQLWDPGAWTIQRNATMPLLFATLDREIVATPDQRPPGVLEIKTTGYRYEDAWADEPPLHVQVQAQAQLAVTGHSWASIAVLIGGQRFLWCDLQRNDRFIAVMLERIDQFWARVEQREPPMPEHVDLDTLRALYPQDIADSVMLPAEALEWDAQWQQAKADAKAAEMRAADAEAKLKAAMGAAALGLLPEGAGRYTWKTHLRREPAREARTIEVRSFRRLKP
jgi:putative phage-type endonuclease